MSWLFLNFKKNCCLLRLWQAEVTVWSNSATEAVVLEASASVDSLEGLTGVYQRSAEIIELSTQNMTERNNTFNLPRRTPDRT